MMGIPEAAGLRYVGQVGTGFTDSQLDALGRLFAPLRAVDVALRRHASERGGGRRPTGSSRRWSARSRSANGPPTACLRHPSWRGLRPDKDPGDVVVAPTA